jgi:hypothetical protein
MPRDPELYPSDAEYYEDPYYQPTNTHELNKAMNYIIINAAFDAEQKEVEDGWDDSDLYWDSDDEDFNHRMGYYDDDEEELTEAQYQDRSWDEYNEGVFTEDLEDD